MNVPQEFAERLERRFDGKLRTRWSPSRSEFHVEQKVRRGIAIGTVNVAPKNAEDRRLNEDELIRARDGYKLVMVVTPGTTRRCKVCNSESKVLPFKSVMTRCAFCNMRGRSEMEAVGFFPLNDLLIEHLEKLRFDSESERGTEAIHEHNRRLLQARDGDLWRPVEAAFRDRINRIRGVQQTGYTGRVFAGTEIGN